MVKNINPVARTTLVTSEPCQFSKLQKVYAGPRSAVLCCGVNHLEETFLGCSSVRYQETSTEPEEKNA